WVGMGRELLSSEPALGQTLDELEQIYVDEMGLSPRQALLEDDLNEISRVQALIFAMQVGLARVWYGYGVRPAAIIGHSVGEVAAAVIAGMLDLPDAARLICRRSRLLRRVAGKGTMAMVNLPFDEAWARLAGRRDVTPAIAASPISTVLSGTIPAMEHIIDQWQSEGLVLRRVNSDVAFHSVDMDSLLADLITEVAGITPRQPTVPVYSTALDDPRANPPRDGAYWAANLRNPVRFADAVADAVEDGHRMFLEVSTHPVVAHSIIETLAAGGVQDGVVVPTLRRDRAERETLLNNLSMLHCHGVSVDWSVLHPAADLADLPTMAWQHRPYWVDAVPAVATGQRQHDVDSHNVLGPRIAVQGASPVSLWQTRLDDSNRPYPGSHAVLGTEVLPAAVVLTSFFAAADFHALTNVLLRVPIAVSTPRDLQVVRQDGTLRLSSCLAGQRDDQSWLTHATAEIMDTPADGGRLDLPALRDICSEIVDPVCVLERLSDIDVAGIGFPWRLEELRRSVDSLLTRVTADPHRVMKFTTWGSLLDAALSVAPIVFPGAPLLRMPGLLREASIHDTPPNEALISLRLVDGPVDIDGPVDDVEVAIDIAMLDGTVVARLPRVRFGVVQREIIAEFDTDIDAGAENVDEGWLALEGQDLHDHLIEAVRRVVTYELRLDPAELGLHRPLVDMGVDSLLSAAIQDRLQRQFKITIPSTLLWNCPTAATVAGYLFELLTETKNVAH
ncbi:MAG: acyltransferase domain-containing protein, partial [Pseudonocardiaceae bacterium]